MNTSEEIKYYISQKSDTGALLVTGKWGCGKTHLIRQIINELDNENQYVAVLISLFGVDSIELLHNEIKNKVFFSRGFEKAQKKSKHIISRVKKFSVNATDILAQFQPKSNTVFKKVRKVFYPSGRAEKGCSAVVVCCCAPVNHVLN